MLEIMGAALPIPEIEAGRGYYGLVQRVPGNVLCLHPGIRLPIIQDTRRLKRKQNPSVLDKFDFRQLAHNVVEHGKIGANDLNLLSDPLMRSDIAGAPLLLTAFGMVGQEELERMSKHREEPRRMGRLLSDFLEVIPGDAAVGMLSASINPEMIKAVGKGELPFTKHLYRKNFSDFSLEAIALLPVPFRNALFEEIAKQSPGYEGAAWKLYQRLSVWWWQYASEQGGRHLVLKNLPRDVAQAHSKATEESFPELAQIIRSQGGNWS